MTYESIGANSRVDAVVGCDRLVVNSVGTHALIANARMDIILTHRAQHTAVVEPSHARCDHGVGTPQVLLAAEELRRIVDVLR